MLGVEQRLGLNDQDGASLSGRRTPSRIEVRGESMRVNAEFAAIERDVDA